MCGAQIYVRVNKTQSVRCIRNVTSVQTFPGRHFSPLAPVTLSLRCWPTWLQCTGRC